MARGTPIPRPETLWCSNTRGGGSNRWSYPPNVEKLLREITEGKTVLQLFGGLSRWGLKLDIDPITKPHVLGDAWMPPFRKDAFDVVLVDPPYSGINQQMKQVLLRGAAYVAKERVIWFHTQWVAPDSGMHRERSWLVRVGDSCACRCIIEWSVRPEKKPPMLRFTRGPALKYNRWLVGNVGLPLEPAERQHPGNFRPPLVSAHGRSPYDDPATDSADKPEVDGAPDRIRTCGPQLRRGRTGSDLPE